MEELDDSRTSQGTDKLRRCRVLAVPAQGLHQGDGLHGRRTESTDRRHHQHLQRLQSMSWQRPADHRGGETRCDAERGDADGVPDHLDRGKFRLPNLDVSAQPDGDGYRGDDPRPANGCGCRDRRLRQDAAGADHGRGERRPADGGDPGRTHGGRASQGRGAGGVYRLPSPVGQVPRGRNRRRRDRNPSTAGSRPRSAPAW